VKEREKRLRGGPVGCWAGFLVPTRVGPVGLLPLFFVLFFFFIFCLQFCLFGNIFVWFWLTFKFSNFCNYVKVFANKSVLLGEV
jgi:hypothetical protein